MTAEITITPEANVDESEQKVIDIGKVSRITRHWGEDILVRDVPAEATYTIRVHEISLFDHRLILDGVPHRMLHMLSR